MFKRKPSRSREFRRSNQVIDIEEERRIRRERREQKKIEEEEKQRREETQKISPRRKRQMRRRALMYTVGILLIVGLLVFSAWDIISLKMEQSHQEARKKELVKQRDHLQNELESVQDPEYIKQQAREQLKLIMPGETLYILPQKPPEEETSEGAVEKE